MACGRNLYQSVGSVEHLYRAVDSTGKTIDSMLSEKRDMKTPTAAIESLKKNKELPKETVMRQAKYLNNIIKQDHRFIKKRTNPMLGFKPFETAMKTIEGIETMHMIKKGHVKLKNLSAPNKVQLLNQLFGMIA